MKNLELDENRRIVANLVYRIRVGAGVTQTQLADKLKVPQSFVSKIETGERQLDIVELRVVCASLGIELIEFLKELEKIINESKS